MQDAAGGYRLRTTSVADLSRVIEGFRTEALRLLAKRYAGLVAREAVQVSSKRKIASHEDIRAAVDEACATIASGLRGSGRVPYPGLNCVIDFHLVNDAILASFVHGHADYRKIWESTAGVVPWGWTPERPEGAAAKGWETRGRYWKAALAKRGFSCPLRFSLIDETLPALGVESLRKFAPAFEKKMAEESARREKELARRSPKPQAIPEEPAPEGRAEQPKTRGGEDQAEEPLTGAKIARRAAEKARRERAASRGRPKDAPRSSIDHADVIVSRDRRTFIAVPYVGFDQQARIFVQVGDSHIAFSQSGMQFGHVSDVPRAAIDILRSCRTVALVETEKNGEKRLLRAKHVAIVSDIGLTENLVSVTAGGFRPAGREIKEWE